MPRLRRPRAVLFDLDGTLVDSHAAIAASIRHLLATYQLPPLTGERFEAALSFPLPGMVATATGETDPAVLAVYEETYMVHYVSSMVETSKPFDGIEAALLAMAEAGHRLGVVTNKSEVNALRVIEGRLGRIPFATIVGQVPGRPPKPDPTSPLLAAEHLGVDPADCWLVGDSVLDLAAAEAAGMTGVAVTWGITPSLAAKLAHAQHSFETPAALLAALRATTD